MTILHKVFHFCAAHRYYNPAFSDEQNLAAFGEDLKLHGHNYELTVSVTGEVNPDTGFLCDLGLLKQVVGEKVIARLDHAHIDAEIDEFRTQQPSTENLVRWIWQQLAAQELGCRLWRVRLRETPTIYTDHYGDAGRE